MNAAVLGFKTWPWVFVSLTPLLMIFGDRVGRHGSSQTQTRGMFSYGGVLQLYRAATQEPQRSTPEVNGTVTTGGSPVTDKVFISSFS
jgi:hypothetical protein